MRASHFLRSNKSSEQPHLACWVDTETRQRRIGKGRVGHYLRFGWACLQRTRASGDWCDPEWYRFTTPGEFWTELLDWVRPKTKLYLFAHNWSFDGPVLDMFRELPRRGWKLYRAVVESPPVILEWRKDKATIKVLDTLNWWRMSLDKVGESLGLRKLPMPKPRAKREEWDTYCRRDVEVIYRAIHAWWSFLRDNDLGSFGPTLASQAFRAYRHRFMPHPILIDSCRPALAMSRDGYHGGRVECYRLGRVKGPIFCYDVNSMYPSVMLHRDYPSVLKLWCRNPTNEELGRWCVRASVVARCRLDVRYPRYAHVSNHKLLFPVGHIETVLTTPDIVSALKTGELVSASEASVYDSKPLFKDFVSSLYSLRLAAKRRGDDVSVWLIKILMNSLYGKFAQRGEVWEVTGEAEDLSVRVWQELDMETGMVRTLRSIAGITQERMKQSESRESHPAIAAHVTAYARAQLWSLMERAGRSNVLYCDTDSLYVTQEGSDRLQDLVDPDALGALKLEGEHSFMVLHGPKDYALPDKVVCKGVRAKATWLDDHTAIQEQWSSLAGLMREGDLSRPTTRRMTKSLARVYDKGIVSPNGTISPLPLSEW